MTAAKQKSLGEKLVWQLVRARWEPLEMSLPRNNPIITQLQAMIDERKPLLDQMDSFQRPPAFNLERHGNNKVDYRYTMQFSYHPGAHPGPYLTQMVLTIGGKEERHHITDMRKLPSFPEARDRLLARIRRRQREQPAQPSQQPGIKP